MGIPEDGAARLSRNQPGGAGGIEVDQIVDGRMRAFTGDQCFKKIQRKAFKGNQPFLQCKHLFIIDAVRPQG